MTGEELSLARKEYLFPAVFYYFRDPLVVAYAKDQYVWDADGNQYLDFFGGIATVSVGHCNPVVNARVHEQLDRLQHVSAVFTTEPQVALAQKVASLTPHGRLTKFFFTNSGTEANETAMLAAQCYAGASDIVALRYAYHGRSLAAMSVTGQSACRLGGVSAPSVIHAHNAYCYRCPFHLTYPNCDLACARDLENAIQTSTSGRIAALGREAEEIRSALAGISAAVPQPGADGPSVDTLVQQFNDSAQQIQMINPLFSHP